MILSNLKLVNFRNYSKAEISLHPKLNIFVGRNASGKTNILESIEILALTKSHRMGNDSNLIKIGEKKTKIIGTVRDGNIRKDLEVDLTENIKKVKKNNREIPKIADYIIKYCLERKSNFADKIELKQLDDNLEEKCRNQLLKKFVK